MAGRNLQMRGYTRLVSPNMGRDEAGHRSRDGSSQAAIMEKMQRKLTNRHDRFIHHKEKLKLAF